MPKIAFLLFNRPMSCFNAMPLSKKTNVAFVGWATKKEELDDKDVKKDFRSYYIDYAAVRDPKADLILKWKMKQIYNLVQEADKGSIVVIPRQTEGVVYFGRVIKFELIDAPSFLECQEYAKMPFVTGKNKGDFKNSVCPPAIEVAQGWRVESWQEVPISLLPRWLQGKLNQQNVPCRITGYKNLGSPFSIFESLLKDNETQSIRSWALLAVGAKDGDILRRLLENVGPTDFEYLVRDLMICEHPDMLWQTGGKLADGGVDVVGFNQVTMEPDTLIQCKWQWNGGRFQLQDASSQVNRKLFVLAETVPESQILAITKTGIKYNGAKEISCLVRKHAKRIPFLKSIGLENVGIPR